MQTGNMIVVSIIEVAALACAYYIGQAAGRRQRGDEEAVRNYFSIPKGSRIAGRLSKRGHDMVVDLTVHDDYGLRV